MMRALLLEHPDDPTAWFVDDEHLLGSDLLVVLAREGSIIPHIVGRTKTGYGVARDPFSGAVAWTVTVRP
jgi:hypothetical protein